MKKSDYADYTFTVGETGVDSRTRKSSFTLKCEPKTKEFEFLDADPQGMLTIKFNDNIDHDQAHAIAKLLSESVDCIFYTIFDN